MDHAFESTYKTGEFSDAYRLLRGVFANFRAETLLGCGEIARVKHFEQHGLKLIVLGKYSQICAIPWRAEDRLLISFGIFFLFEEQG